VKADVHVAVLVLPVLGAPEEVFQEYGPRRRDVFGDKGPAVSFQYRASTTGDS
jgi:hypothetical protein